jgi:hypothetical protein
MAPGEDEWLNAAPEPLLRYTHGEARMALFDPAGWCAHYNHGKNDCDRLKGIYEQFLMRQRQMAAVLEAHGVPVLFVHCEAGQDARELLARAEGSAGRWPATPDLRCRPAAGTTDREKRRLAPAFS